MKKLKILAKTYDLEFLNSKKMSLKYDGTEDNFINGMISEENSEISIDIDLQVQDKRITIMHEVTHAILNQLGYFELTDNETFVTGISNAITQTLVDNPNLTKLFMK